MNKWRWFLLAFLTMFLAGAISTILMIVGNKYQYWGWQYISVIPLLIWFVLGQIFIVPKIVGKNYRWGLFLICVAMMFVAISVMAIIQELGGGWLGLIAPLLWVVWGLIYVMPRLKASEDKNQ